MATMMDHLVITSHLASQSVSRSVNQPFSELVTSSIGAEKAFGAPIAECTFDCEYLKLVGALIP